MDEEQNAEYSDSSDTCWERGGIVIVILNGSRHISDLYLEECERAEGSRWRKSSKKRCDGRVSAG